MAERVNKNMEATWHSPDFLDFLMWCCNEEPLSEDGIGGNEAVDAPQGCRKLMLVCRKSDFSVKYSYFTYLAKIRHKFAYLYTYRISRVIVPTHDPQGMDTRDLEAICLWVKGLCVIV